MQITSYFSPAFIESIMQQFAPETTIRVQQVSPLPVDNSASILAVLTAGRTDKPVGHFGLEVSFTRNHIPEKRRLVMKIKPHGDEIVEMLNSLALACGTPLAATYPAYKSLTGFQHTHGRELEIYQKLSGSLFPEIFGVYQNEAEVTYIILMEFLEEVELLNSVMRPEKWTDDHIKAALTQLAQWHATYLVAPNSLNQEYWSDAPSLTYMQELAPLWDSLVQNASRHLPHVYTPERVQILQDIIGQIPDYWQALKQLPKTLIHNDLNPRNTCFKRTAAGELQFCVYDWELATWHIPQYDVVELLCFVLDEDRYHLRLPYLEFYRQELHQLTGQFADTESFQQGFRYAAFDFGLHRLGMYLMAHSVSPYPFLPRVVNSFFDTLAQTMVSVSAPALTETVHT